MKKTVFLAADGPRRASKSAVTNLVTGGYNHE